MQATFPVCDPVPDRLDELVDGLYLLHQCKERGVSDLDRLVEYIEFTMDEIERHRLGRSSELLVTNLA
jgi:hypothetical protein